MAKSLAPKHKYTSYIVNDFETTGLHMNKCGLTEFAAVALDGMTLEKIGEVEGLIKPHQICDPKTGKWFDPEWQPGAEKVTGLTFDKCNTEGEDIDDFVELKVIPFLEKANTCNSKTGYRPVLIAQNAQFEVQCWQNLACGRFDLSKYFHGSVDFYGNFQPHYIDTLDLAKLTWAANQRMTAYKLADIMERAGIPLIDAHRAMNDVKPTSTFFEMCINKLRNAGAVVQQNEDGSVAVDQRTFKFQLPIINEQ